MARSTNNLSSLLRSFDGNQKGRGQRGIPGAAGNTPTGATPQSVVSGKQPGLGGPNSAGRNAAAVINFGHPSSSHTRASANTSSDWEKLLQQTASGGLLSALTGGSGLGSIGGLGSLISGVINLFGGSGPKALAPLQRFQLPASQNQTITIGASGGSATAPGALALQDHSAEIAQAVKTALLHSSSLADVISEL